MFISDYIKTKPHLYDFLKRYMRLIPERQDKIYRAFQKITEYYERNIVFLQIGANDGLRSDPIREFVVRDAWKGLMIEPIPTSYELLVENYKYLSGRELFFLNAAVTEAHGGNIPFYTYDEEKMDDYTLEEKMDYLRKASFDRKHLENFAHSKNKNPDNLIKEVQIPTVNINLLADEYPILNQLNLLVIDAEGHEWVILKSLEFNRIKPDIIFYESHNLSADKDPGKYLQENGFDLTKIGGDTLATNREIRLDL